MPHPATVTALPASDQLSVGGPKVSELTIRLHVLLWDHPGRADDLAVFEDAVLALLPNHGGHLLIRDRVLDRSEGDPLEIQLIEMSDEEALSNYLEDPARSALVRSHGRDALIAHTQLLRVDPIASYWRIVNWHADRSRRSLARGCRSTMHERPCCPYIFGATHVYGG